jgi:hypothetical protein
MQEIKLVPGRECGDCTICCSVPGIDKPEIQKPSGVACRHLCGGRCDIYETRPPVCRGFFCGWRQLADLDESWRPDRSGVFIEFESLDNVPGLNLTLVGNPLKTLRQPWLIDFIASGVSRNLPLLLTLPGPVGHQGAKSLLNTRQMREAASVSRGRVKDLLEVALKRLRQYDFKPHVMAHGGNDMGAA